MKTAFKLVLLTFVLFLGAFLTIGCDGGVTTPAGPDGFNLILVANQNANTLSVVNLDDNIVLRDRTTVGNVPNDLIYHDNKLYVINSVSNDMNILRLSDDNMFSTIQTPFDLGVNRGNSPQYGTIASGYMFVSNFNTDDVNVIRLDDMLSVVNINVGTAPQDILAVDDKVYVACSAHNFNANSYDEGTVSVLSVETRERLKSIPIGIGKNPQYLALDADNRLHVVCTGNYNDIAGEVFVIDTELDEVVIVISLRGTPGEVAITSTNDAYIAAGGWGDDPGQVYRYNARTGQVINGPDNPIEVSTGAMRVCVDNNDNVYVSCFGDNTVDKIMNGSVVESYEVGDGPAPMVFIAR